MTEYVRLGDVCDISAGQGAPQGDDMYCKQGGKPFIKAGNLEWLSSGGSLNAIQQVNDKTVKSHKLRLYSKGSVVFAKSGMSCKKSFVYVLEENCYIVSHLACLTPKKIESDFLKYYLQAHPPSELIKNESYPSIKLSDISDILIPPLPLEEQKRIAAALDTMYSVIAKRKQLIALLDEAAKSLFVEMFGDPVENPMGWEVVELKELSTKIGSGSTPKGGNQSYVENGISFIRSLNVYNNRFKSKDLAHITPEQAKKLDNVTLQKDDVLINITGASVARSCIVPEDVLPARVNQHVSIIRCIIQKLNPTYLNYLLTDGNYQHILLSVGEAGGATREAITKSQLNSLKIPLPPLDLQNLFAARIEALEAQRASCERGLRQMETAFSAMMQEYFG